MQLENIHPKEKEVLMFIHKFNEMCAATNISDSNSLLIIKGKWAKFRIDSFERQLALNKIQFDHYTCGSLFIKHSHCKFVIKRIGSPGTFF